MSQSDRLNESILEKVAHENWNANRHVDPEVLEDLGYATPETLADVAQTTLRRQKAGESFSIQSLIEIIGDKDLTPPDYLGKSIVVRQIAPNKPKVAPVVLRGRIRDEKGNIHIDRKTLSARGKRIADEAPQHIRDQHKQSA